jgi:Fe-S oxidoreductase
LQLYKPEYVSRVLDFLRGSRGSIDLHSVCCKHDPALPRGSHIINTCAGCDRRFSTLYEGITTVSLWEVLAGSSDGFPFPDYKGLVMSVHDACPIRTKGQVHAAIRALLAKMNIAVVEAAQSGANSVCCGDSFYPALPIADIHALMQKRAADMPCDDVCVYCVSCIKSMYIGGRRPRSRLDRLFTEPTDPPVYDTVAWHAMVQAYTDAH